MLSRRMETERSSVATTTWWLVSGERGAVQFMLMYIKSLDMFIPIDLGVHSKEPLFEGQIPIKCSVIDEDCYFQESSLGAQKLYTEYLILKDSQIIWDGLESVYGQIFN